MSQSSSTKTGRMLSLIKVGVGIYWCITWLVAETTPFFLMLSTPYRIYPRELVRSLGTDVTLDGILTVLDEHYNNVKALDALNQELFQLQMGKKETVSG